MYTAASGTPVPMLIIFVLPAGRVAFLVHAHALNLAVQHVPQLAL